MRRKVGAFLTLVVMICVIGQVDVDAAAKSKTKSWSKGKIDYKATLTISEEPVEKCPIISSQSRHKKGTQTMIGISTSVSTSATASVDVTAGYSAVATLEASLGLSYSQSLTVSTNIEYTLKKEKSGRYRIEVWYPGKVETLKLRVTNNYTNKSSRITKKSKYTPIKKAQYKVLVRYADL